MTDTTTAIAPQAGWYPDPSDSRAYRWWSGDAWTEHLTPALTRQHRWGLVPVPERFELIDGAAKPSRIIAETVVNARDQEAERNRAGVVVIVIGLVAVMAYLGSLAFAYSTVLPLIPALAGLAGAVPAFRRARTTGKGLPISLFGVLFSGFATVLSVLPLLPALLGLPSADEVTSTQNLISSTIGFHTTVEGKLVAAAQHDYGQPASSASCPSDALLEKGSTFSCTETLTDGTTKLVNVTVIDDTGTVTWTPAS